MPRLVHHGDTSVTMRTGGRFGRRRMAGGWAADGGRAAGGGRRAAGRRMAGGGFRRLGFVEVFGLDAEEFVDRLVQGGVTG